MAVGPDPGDGHGRRARVTRGALRPLPPALLPLPRRPAFRHSLSRVRRISRAVRGCGHRPCGRGVEDRVRVLLREVSDTHWATGGVTTADTKAAGTH